MSGSVLDMIARPATMSPNLLEAYGHGVGIANQQALGQIMRGRIAAGQEAVNALNPDGTMDMARFGAGLRGNPAAAANGQEALTSGQALAAAQQQQMAQRQGLIISAVTGAMKAPDGQLSDAVAVGMQRLIDAGVVPRNQGMAMLARLPNDPAAMRARLEQFRVSLLPGGEQGAQIYGTRQDYDNGQQIVGGVQLPASAGGAIDVPPQPGVQTFPSRAALAGREIVGYDPATKAPIYGPAAAVMPPNLAGPAAQPSPLGTGRLPPALRNPAASNGAPAQSAQPFYAGTNPTGVVAGAPGPGQTAALGTSGTTSANAFQQHATEDAQAQQQTAVLDNMLANTSQFVTGPGQFKKFRQTMVSWAPQLATALGVKPESIASLEDFDKLVAQIVTAQGGQTDARMAVTEQGTPHSGLTPGGVDMIVRQLQGNADYIRARAKLASVWGDKANYPGFQSSVSALDPRVFQVQRMTPEQRHTYYTGMDAKAKADFQQAWTRTQALIGGGGG